MHIRQRIAPAVQRRRKLPVVRDVPDVYLVRRAVRRAAREPLAVGAVRHRAPRRAVDRVAEPVCRLELLLEVVALGRRRGVKGHGELAERAVGRVGDDAAKAGERAMSRGRGRART